MPEDFKDPAIGDFWCSVLFCRMAVNFHRGITAGTDPQPPSKKLTATSDSGLQMVLPRLGGSKERPLRASRSDSRSGFSGEPLQASVYATVWSTMRRLREV